MPAIKKTKAHKAMNSRHTFHWWKELGPLWLRGIFFRPKYTRTPVANPPISLMIKSKSKNTIKIATEKKPIKIEKTSLMTDFGWSKSGKIDAKASKIKAETLVGGEKLKARTSST